MKKLNRTFMSLAIGLTVAGLATPALAAPYQIQPDDTFWKISRAKHIPLEELEAANPNAVAENLQFGQIIQLPDAVSASSKTSTSVDAKTVTAPSGEALPYKKVISTKATAYTASASENGPWGAVDYLGGPLKLGTIAVDPSVVPLGSTVYITGYDCDGLPEGGMIAKATDIGGAIKGNRIDIFLPGSTKKANSFGRQNVKLFVLNK
jgi:3D (Asp-Asp-Asp) domain-containing protein